MTEATCAVPGRRLLHARAVLVALLYTLTALVMLLRLVVIRNNTEASDEHLRPLEIILSSGRLPHIDDCFECYQPKLYYLLEAYLFRAFQIRDPLTRLEFGGYLDWLACGALALALWAFLQWRELTPLERAISFALPMSSPGITIVSTQPSNDGLVIGLSAVAVVAFWRWSDRRRSVWLVLAMGAAALAAAAKGSGLVIMAAVLAGMAMQPLRFWRAHLGQAALAAVLAVVGCVGVLSAGYADNRRDKGSFLALNMPKSPPPPFWPGARLADAGCNSYSEAYLTFPIASELRVPFVGWNADGYNPPHRSNLWTMMHGSHFYSRFQRWPDTWASTAPFTVAVGRAEIALGLLTLGLLVAGLLRRLRSHARLLFQRGPLRFVGDGEVWVTGTLVMMLAMMIKLSADYRWAQAMKSFYAYPAMVGFTAALASGLGLLGRRWMQIGAGAVAVLLVGLHALDTGVLAADLSRTIDERAARLAGRITTMRDGDFDIAGLLPHATLTSGSAKAGSTADGEPAYCDRAIHDHVIGATSPSDVEFPLGRSWSRFRSRVCNAPRATQGRSGVRFQIIGDDRLLWDSGVVLAGRSLDADVPVVGLGRLRLIVAPLDPAGHDTPLWIDPMLKH